jgi:hypothetical protein
MAFLEAIDSFWKSPLYSELILWECFQGFAARRRNMCD